MRSGQNAAVEGSLPAVSLLQDAAWEVTDQLNLEEIENAEDPFGLLLSLLDRLFQHDEDVELLARCEEFFQDFSRLKRCKPIFLGTGPSERR